MVIWIVSGDFAEPTATQNVNAISQITADTQSIYWTADYATVSVTGIVFVVTIHWG